MTTRVVPSKPIPVKRHLQQSTISWFDVDRKQFHNGDDSQCLNKISYPPVF
jgi:hypothetical protein